MKLIDQRYLIENFIPHAEALMKRERMKNTIKIDPEKISIAELKCMFHSFSNFVDSWIGKLTCYVCKQDFDAVIEIDELQICQSCLKEALGMFESDNQVSSSNASTQYPGSTKAGDSKGFSMKKVELKIVLEAARATQI